MQNKLSEREQIAMKTMSQLQSPKHIRLNKNNLYAVQITETEPQHMKMGYAVNAAIMGHPYIFSIYKEMEQMNDFKPIHIVHKNLVDLCKLISTKQLKQVEIKHVYNHTVYSIYTDMVNTMFISKFNNSTYIWLFEKDRLVACDIQNATIKLTSGRALINRRMSMIQAYTLLESMGYSWMDGYPVEVRGNDSGRLIRWVHHPSYEEILAYWISRGDKVEIDTSGVNPVFVRKSLVRSIKQPDGTFKNIREPRNDRVDTYDKSQLLLNK